MTPVSRWILVGPVTAALAFTAVLILRRGPETLTPNAEEPSPAVTETLVVPGTAVPAIRDDAREDGWETEVFSSVSDEQLSVLGRWVEAEGPLDAALLEAAVSSTCSATPLRPGDLEEVFRDRSFVVRRPRAQPSAAPVHQGAPGLARALREIIEPFPEASDIHVKFKTYRVELAAPGLPATTRSYFQARGRAAGGPFQIRATWRMTWSTRSSGERPLLESLALEEYEESAGTGGMFSECTEAVFQGNAVFDSQLRPGVDHWTARIDASLGIDIGGWQGLTLGDVNGDGLDDLYVCQPGGLPNRLFLQLPDGTAVEGSAAAGVDWLDSTHAALLVDLDNDGDQDLAASVDSGILLLANDGRGKFSMISAEVIPAAIPYSLAAADVDEDGDLDLYICCYNPRAGVNRHLLFARPVPYHDAQNGGPNVLLRNDGEGRFTHVTKQVGLDENNRRFSYAASWEDYDNDGDLDLYVANDFGRDNLYRNDGGRFRDVAVSSGADDISPGMSISWGDYDNDGLMDVYVSDMFSSAGNRITFQEKFQPDANAKTRSELQRHAHGNTLYRNLGDGTFEDVSDKAGVVLGRWAWGSKFLDWNNDGWEDILVTNGFITQAEDKGDL